jgi:hypothetical protein
MLVGRCPLPYGRPGAVSLAEQEKTVDRAEAARTRSLWQGVAGGPWARLMARGMQIAGKEALEPSREHGDET